MPGQKRVEDARERAYARASIFLRKFLRTGWIAGSSPAMTISTHRLSASADDDNRNILTSFPQPEASSPPPREQRQRRERRQRRLEHPRPEPRQARRPGRRLREERRLR